MSFLENFHPLNLCMSHPRKYLRLFVYSHSISQFHSLALWASPSSNSRLSRLPVQKQHTCNSARVLQLQLSECHSSTWPEYRCTELARRVQSSQHRSVLATFASQFHVRVLACVHVVVVVLHSLRLQFVQSCPLLFGNNIMEPLPGGWMLNVLQSAKMPERRI